MFGLLARLLSLFRRDERLLFRYWDGQRWRYADPVASYRAIWTSGDFASDCSIAANPLKDNGQPLHAIQDVYAAEDRLRAMTRQVFGVKAWSENEPGLTLDETDELLNSFMAYCADLKKKRKALPTSSPPSESMPEPGLRDTDVYPPGPPPDLSSMPSESSAAAHSGY